MTASQLNMEYVRMYACVQVFPCTHIRTYVHMNSVPTQKLNLFPLFLY